MVKLQGQGHRVKKWYPRKGLITGNIHVKYQSSGTHCLKVISTAKVLKKNLLDSNKAEKKFRSRRRQKHPELWKQNIRKQKRNAREDYISCCGQTSYVVRHKE